MKKLLLFFLLPAVVASCKSIYHADNVSQLPPDQYFEKMKITPDFTVIDVRTKMEYKKQHLENAHSASLLSFRFKKKVAGLDRNKPVFIYCETAHRSPFAARKLRRMGFVEITDLKKGYKPYRKSLREKPAGGGQ
ncbi:MAG: rhodanese-like domain-containing protein [Lewinellaceae bacterium]|nr:rhodanese-like domain-containing protein [Saprospiraceae bacterium]MCB9341592.1 rhodanese-like domain-containing protein [Lewinellaceae bacterium]